MSLPNGDPSNPALPAPIFADTDAGRGDHLRANNQKIWQNFDYLEANKVQTSGDETIAGVKTFSSSPIVPMPTTDYQAAPRKFITDRTLDDISDGTTYKRTSQTEKDNYNAGYTGSNINAATADTPVLTDLFGFWKVGSSVLRKITREALAKLFYPVGSYINHAGTTAPEGFLACQGQNVSRTTYADLFAVLGVTYGVGDGSTTFGLPDARGLVMVGAGAHGTMTRANSTAYNGGSVGASRNDQQQGHSHRIMDSFDGWRTVATGSLNNVGGNRGLVLADSPDGRVEARTPFTDDTNGPPRTGDETRPAEIAVLVCIKY